ncbi:MAG: Fpg/Nei family DNA glycosylase [Thermoleophilia bacterium]|nr:Fpg/Nei family DNA glycosylase [Thermoleophilia bacterium]
MPEGHVAHRNAGLWNAHLVGRTVTGATSSSPRALAQDIPGRLRGDVLASAEARGKHHIMRFASGRVLLTHLRMNGVWRLGRGTPRGRPRNLTLALEFGDVTAALYRCQSVRLLEPGEPLPPGVRRVGPDLLDDAVDPAATTRDALAATDPGREVGEAVMDQTLVSGIGNVYKSESLFLAGVDPWRAVGTLTSAEAEDVGRIAAELLRRGVRDGGAITTFDPPSRPWRRPGGERWVYRRVDEPCRRCGARIRARGQGDENRTTYWCPSCQK